MKNHSVLFHANRSKESMTQKYSNGLNVRISIFLLKTFSVYICKKMPLQMYVTYRAQTRQLPLSCVSFKDNPLSFLSPLSSLSPVSLLSILKPTYV